MSCKNFGGINLSNQDFEKTNAHRYGRLYKKSHDPYRATFTTIISNLEVFKFTMRTGLSVGEKK